LTPRDETRRGAKGELSFFFLFFSPEQEGRGREGGREGEARR